MKKIFIISSAALAFAALVMGVASCSKQGETSELGKQNGVCPLMFTASAQESDESQTRATQQTYTTDATLPAAFTIHSTAWFKPNDGSKESTYFFDAPFTKQGSSWQNDSYKYWPVGGLLEFLCIAVDDSIMPLSDFDAFKWNDNKSTSSVTIDIPNMQKMQSEVLFAAKKPTDRDAAVDLDFKHSQSLLEFSFTVGTAEDNDLIRLDSLTIDSIYMIGKLKVNNSGSEPAASWNFNYSYPVTAYVPDVRNTYPVNSTATKKYLIVPSQNAGVITLAYTKRTSTTEDWSKGSSYTVKLNDSVSPWVMGTKYTFNVTFNHTDNTVTTPESYVTVTAFSGNWSMSLVFEN